MRRQYHYPQCTTARTNRNAWQVHLRLRVVLVGVGWLGAAALARVRGLALLVDRGVGVSVVRRRGKPKVEVVVPAPLAVHLVDEEAGDGLEQQAKDGHARAEAEDVAAD